MRLLLILMTDHPQTAPVSGRPLTAEDELIEPCGGCGETNPSRRCLGCLHDFVSRPASEQPVEASGAGRVTVPVEPTEEMIQAFHRASWPKGPAVSPLSQAGQAFVRAYRAMLAARPAAPTQSAAQTGEEEDWRLVRQLVEMMDEWSSSLALRTNDGACTGFPDHEAALRRIAALSQPEPSHD